MGVRQDSLDGREAGGVSGRQGCQRGHLAQVSLSRQPDLRPERGQFRFRLLAQDLDPAQVAIDGSQPGGGLALDLPGPLRARSILAGPLQHLLGEGRAATTKLAQPPNAVQRAVGDSLPVRQQLAGPGRLQIPQAFLLEPLRQNPQGVTQA